MRNSPSAQMQQTFRERMATARLNYLLDAEKFPSGSEELDEEGPDVLSWGHGPETTMQVSPLLGEEAVAPGDIPVFWDELHLEQEPLHPDHVREAA